MGYFEIDTGSFTWPQQKKNARQQRSRPRCTRGTCLQAFRMRVASTSAPRSRSIQEDVPSTSLLLPRSAPTHTSYWRWCTSSGALSVSSPWIHLECHSCEGLQWHMPLHVAALDLAFSYSLFVSWSGGPGAVTFIHLMAGKDQWLGSTFFPVHKISLPLLSRSV